MEKSVSNSFNNFPNSSEASQIPYYRHPKSAMDEETVRFAFEAVRFCYLTRKYKKKKERRRWWVRPTYVKRNQDGFYEKTYKYIKENDEELFFNATRMNRTQYDLLLNLVAGYLKKTSIRKAIEPECRLAVTLM